MLVLPEGLGLVFPIGTKYFRINAEKHDSNRRDHKIGETIIVQLKNRSTRGTKYDILCSNCIR